MKESPLVNTHDSVKWHFGQKVKSPLTGSTVATIWHVRRHSGNGVVFATLSKNVTIYQNK